MSRLNEFLVDLFLKELDKILDRYVLVSSFVVGGEVHVLVLEPEAEYLVIKFQCSAPSRWFGYVVAYGAVEVDCLQAKFFQGFLDFFQLLCIEEVECVAVCYAELERCAAVGR